MNRVSHSTQLYTLQWNILNNLITVQLDYIATVSLKTSVYMSYDKVNTKINKEHISHINLQTCSTIFIIIFFCLVFSVILNRKIDNCHK